MCTHLKASLHLNLTPYQITIVGRSEVFVQGLRIRFHTGFPTFKEKMRFLCHSSDSCAEIHGVIEVLHPYIEIE